DITINGNTLTGNGAADYGVRVYQYDEGCTGNVNGNTISQVDVASVYQEYIYYSIVDIKDNTIEGNSSDYGIYHYYAAASLFSVTGNDVSGYDDYGLFVDDYLEYGGVYTFSNNTFTGDGTGSGIYFSDYFEYGPTVRISGNTITQFDSTGIYIYDLYEGGACIVSENILTAAPNTASAIGIYWDYIESGGGLGEVVGNTVNLNGGSSDGLYFYFIEEGAKLLVGSNQVTGYRGNGLYFDDYIEYGASVTITNNVFH